MGATAEAELSRRNIIGELAIEEMVRATKSTVLMASSNRYIAPKTSDSTLDGLVRKDLHFYAFQKMSSVPILSPHTCARPC